MLLVLVFYYILLILDINIINLNVDWTALMVVATFIAIIVNIIINHKDRKSNQEKFQESNRANILFYFEQQGHKLYLVLKNFGLTEAKSVQISVNPPILNSEETNFASFFNNINIIFPPNFSINSFFDMSNEYINEVVGSGEFPTYHVKVEYFDIYNEHHVFEYDLNLEHINGVSFLGNEQNSIQVSLSEISDSIRRRQS
jgi:hypothetical protein